MGKRQKEFIEELAKGLTVALVDILPDVRAKIGAYLNEFEDGCGKAGCKVLLAALQPKVTPE